ncbi:MAG TPA: hypothetical protein VFB97_02300, partial [Bacteroidales bacterium]|nr:hypothetical protein [Bacteroidales bacterium]
IMSRFRILRVDHYDPVKVGRKNRIFYSIYGVIPTLFILAIDIGAMNSKHSNLILYGSMPFLGLILFFLLRKIRSDIKNLKTIGEIEITQSGLKKKIGDSQTDYNFSAIKELTLTKHMPGTKMTESKSRYFSYILKIALKDGFEELMVVSDRSIDHDHKLSIADTMKTLKRIAPIKVNIS